MCSALSLSVLFEKAYMVSSNERFIPTFIDFSEDPKEFCQKRRRLLEVKRS